MLLLVLILVLIAFGLLVVALLSGSVLWAWVSVGVSVTAAVVLLVDWLQRRSAGRAGDDVAGAQAAAPATVAPADLEPATEFLPVVPASPRPGLSGAADEPAARNGVVPEGSEPRFDPASDVSRTAVLPAATPSGSAERPSGAAPDSAPFGANPSLSVTGSGSDRADDDAVAGVADGASGPPSAAEPGPAPEDRSDAPAVDLFTRDPAERDEQAARVPAPPDPTWSSSGPDPERSDDHSDPGVESTVVVQARPADDSTAPSHDATQEDATREDGPPQDAAPQDAAPQDAERPDTPLQDAAPPPDAAPQEAAPQDAAPREASVGNAVVGAAAAPVESRSSDAPPPRGAPTDAPAEERGPTGGPGADPSAVPPLGPDGELPEEPHDGPAAALVAGLEDEVVVVDEQPRYHVTGCRSLAGSPLIPLPVREAVELGFTPCGWCTPARTLAGRHPTAAAKGR